MITNTQWTNHSEEHYPCPRIISFLLLKTWFWNVTKKKPLCLLQTPTWFPVSYLWMHLALNSLAMMPASYTEMYHNLPGAPKCGWDIQYHRQLIKKQVAGIESISFIISFQQPGKQWNKTKGKKLSCARLSLFLLRAADTLKNWQGGNQTLSFVLLSNTLFTLSQLGHCGYLFLWFQRQPLEQKLLVSPFQIKLSLPW